MSSDAVRLLEIQLDVHKRRLQQKGERIQELEAQNIDLEAQVNHLREIVDKERTPSRNVPGPGPAADLSTYHRKGHGGAEGWDREIMRPNGHSSNSNDLEKKRSEPDRIHDEPLLESGGPESKKRKLSPEVMQPRPSSSGDYAVGNSRGHSAAADVRSADGAKDGADKPPVGREQSLNFPRPPEPAPVPVTPSVPSSSPGGIFGPSSRTYDLVSPYQRSDPVEDSEPESESSSDQAEDYVIHVQTSRSSSPTSTLEARTANVAPFDHGIVAEEYLEASDDRQTLGKRLGCSGNGTVVRGRDGTDYLFPHRKQHPYAPAEQGMPGLFFSAILDRTLSMTYEVLVGISPGKYKYMGEYKLRQMDALSPEEFQSLPRGTKTFWANNILKQKKFGPIRHRLLQNRTYSKNLDAADIVRAYEKGEEKLYVWRMKCIEYDDELLCQATGLPLEEGHCCGI
ncbi:hypothetical protein LXA43DRAFT_1018260 [Ganoderma leucocontextum]|nr:hypothetical protein LXA43DRAFT_1018260 [Ganoderma leucocontextum]